MRCVAFLCLILLGSTCTAQEPEFVAQLFPERRAQNVTFARMADRLYLIAGPRGGTETWDIWSTDGTTEGTHEVLDSRQAGGLAPYLTQFFDVEGRTYFMVRKDASLEIWRTDGSADGTTVAVTLPGVTLKHSKVTTVGEFALFPASDDEHGREVWRTDGTQAGTFLLKDIKEGPESGCWSDSFAVQSDRAYFWADDGVRGYELWTTDGSGAGTRLFKEFTPGKAGTRYHEVYATAGHVYFWLSVGEDLWHLWISDGSEGGTRRIPSAVHHGYKPADPPGIVEAGDKVFFTVDDGEHGRELWVSDGTDSGTHMVRDVCEGPAGSNPHHLHAIGPLVYFTATRSSPSRCLWQSDGTKEGTQRVSGFDAGSSSPSTLWGANGRTLVVEGLVEVEGNSNRVYRVWVIDGETPGPRVLIPDVRDGEKRRSYGWGPSTCVYKGSAYYLTGHDDNEMNLNKISLKPKESTD